MFESLNEAAKRFIYFMIFLGWISMGLAISGFSWIVILSPFWGMFAILQVSAVLIYLINTMKSWDNGR